MKTQITQNPVPVRWTKTIHFLLGWATLASAIDCLAEAPEIVAVSSRVAKDYVRAKQADGTFEPETYVFGEGGRWNTAMVDASLKKVEYKHVAFQVSKPLAAQNYFRAQDPDPNKNKLLIMVYWGMTHGTEDTSGSGLYQDAIEGARPEPLMTDNPVAPRAWEKPDRSAASGARRDNLNQMLMMVSMLNRLKDRTDHSNASILGYDQEFPRSAGLEIGPIRTRQQAILEEISINRYFVVLMAYDFQLLWKKKEPKLLWVTRFSIPERGNLFDEQLEAMARAAARYFGQDSHGLRRDPLPKGRVDLGDLKIMEVVPETKR